MSRVLLVHWHEAEGRERAAKLRGHGYEVALHWDQAAGGALTRALASRPPAAVVVDLGRLPSHGRAVATWMRGRKATRRVPIVFVPGDAAKTARLRAAFPDAACVPWSRMRAALAKAIANPPRDPVVPAARDYSGTPLWKKLGIGPGARVALVRAPQGFRGRLGALPDGAKTTSRLAGECAVVVLFCRALAELRADWRQAVARLGDKGGLWVAWPKKASGTTTDLDAGVVRAFGLDQGLVDNKVCAVDEVWSALRFARRRRA